MLILIGIALALFAAAGGRPDGGIVTPGERIDSLEQGLTAVADGLGALVEPADSRDRRLAAVDIRNDRLDERMDSLQQDPAAIGAVWEALSNSGAAGTRPATLSKGAAGQSWRSRSAPSSLTVQIWLHRNALR